VRSVSLDLSVARTAAGASSSSPGQDAVPSKQSGQCDIATLKRTFFLWGLPLREAKLVFNEIKRQSRERHPGKSADHIDFEEFKEFMKPVYQWALGKGMTKTGYKRFAGTSASQSAQEGAADKATPLLAST